MLIPFLFPNSPPLGTIDLASTETVGITKFSAGKPSLTLIYATPENKSCNQ